MRAYNVVVVMKLRVWGGYTFSPACPVWVEEQPLQRERERERAVGGTTQSRTLRGRVVVVVGGVLTPVLRLPLVFF